MQISKSPIISGYENKFQIGGINFPIKYVPGTNYSFKKLQQNKFSMKYILAEQISRRNKYFVTD
jgi:hypothetical protein